MPRKTVNMIAFQRIHRMGHFVPGRNPRPIIAAFRDDLVKQSVIMNAKNATGHSITSRCLAELEGMVVCLDDQKKERYILQIRQIQVDTSLPVYDQNMTVDKWWAKISKGEKYGDQCKLFFFLC